MKENSSGDDPARESRFDAVTNAACRGESVKCNEYCTTTQNSYESTS